MKIEIHHPSFHMQLKVMEYIVIHLPSLLPLKEKFYLNEH